jgi:hypothetical protein
MKLNDLLLRNGLQLVDIPKFRSCIKFINGTSIEICKPWNNDIRWSWFNKHKKMYHMNNPVVFNHDGLFIYVDGGYPNFFHDVNI